MIKWFKRRKQIIIVNYPGYGLTTETAEIIERKYKNEFGEDYIVIVIFDNVEQVKITLLK